MNILQKFDTIRAYTEQLCKPLKKEDYGVQVATFASPTKWHLAHTTWFFETFILQEHAEGYKVYDPDFNYLFNSYYNNVGKRVMRADRGNMSRPTVDEVYHYRAFVDEQMRAFLASKPSDTILKIIELGLQHEQQHQELLMTDLKYMLGHNPLFPSYDDQQCLVHQYKNNPPKTVSISEGIYSIGHVGDAFCYDNELGAHKVYLNAFEIHTTLVSNGDFLEFVEDGGYQNFNLWHEAGWHWVCKHDIKAPLYWHQIDDTWHYYTLAGLQKLDPSAPLCHVNFYEAFAFAQWKGCRLPTEFEWEVASSHLGWGDRWEWTYSAYLPYPGFKIAKGAIGEYNGKFMVNQMVLRGASVATSPLHSRHTYRNFFHTDERWQYTGIRLIKP